MVKKLADENGVECRCFHADIPKMAKERHCSEEEMGRIFRYECFEKVRCELGFSKIAVAHHMDDQAETVLFQLARGSALRGLCGMMPKNGYIIRPLLAVCRAEIEDELAQSGIPYSQDSTNFDETYSRNRMRHNVLPYLEENIQAETVSHIARTAEYMQELRSYVERQAGKLFDDIVSCGGGRAEVSAERLRMEDTVLQRECLFMMMERVCGRRKDLTGKHVEQLLSLLKGGTGKRLSLPYDMSAGKDYDVFWIICRSTEKTPKERMIILDCSCAGSLVLAGDDFHKIKWERISVNEHGSLTQQVCAAGSTHIGGLAAPDGRSMTAGVDEQGLPDYMEKNSCAKWFDYGKIKNALVFRKPQQGDYLWISPNGNKKKLSRLFIDRKISLSERNRLWVLAEGAHILWVPGLNRGSAYYYVGEDTVDVLLINEEGKDT